MCLRAPLGVDTITCADSAVPMVQYYDESRKVLLEQDAQAKAMQAGTPASAKSGSPDGSPTKSIRIVVSAT